MKNRKRRRNHEYYEKHRDHLVNKHREYNQANKEVIAAKQRKYNKANRDVIAEKQRREGKRPFEAAVTSPLGWMGRVQAVWEVAGGLNKTNKEEQNEINKKQSY